MRSRILRESDYEIIWSCRNDVLSHLFFFTLIWSHRSWDAFCFCNELIIHYETSLSLWMQVRVMFLMWILLLSAAPNGEYLFFYRKWNMNLQKWVSLLQKYTKQRPTVFSMLFLRVLCNHTSWAVSKCHGNRISFTTAASFLTYFLYLYSQHFVRAPSSAWTQRPVTKTQIPWLVRTKHHVINCETCSQLNID